MRTDGIFRLYHPFDYYRPVVDGDEVNYSLARSDRGTLLQGQMGTMVLVCKEAMTLGGIVRDLKDANGTDIQVVDGQPYDLYVHSADAQFDVFANLIGWKHTLRRTRPKSFEEYIDSLVPD